jgi:hypothetical protein
VMEISHLEAQLFVLAWTNPFEKKIQLLHRIDSFYFYFLLCDNPLHLKGWMILLPSKYTIAECLFVSSKF